MDKLMIIEEKISCLEESKLKNKEDYEKWANYINNLEHDVYNYYENEKRFNKHDYLKCKVFLLLLSLENIMKQLIQQSVLRFNNKFTIEVKFDMFTYAMNLRTDFSKVSIAKKCAEMFANKSYENIPPHIKILLKKFDCFQDSIDDVMSNFLVEFYSKPIDKEMASRISKDVTNSVFFTTLS